MSEVLKPCSRCGKSLPLDQFYKLAASSDGRQAWCKECQSEAHKAWQSRPDVKVRLAEYMRSYRRRKKTAK